MPLTKFHLRTHVLSSSLEEPLPQRGASIGSKIISEYRWLRAIKTEPELRRVLNSAVDHPLNALLVAETHRHAHSHTCIAH